MSLRSDLVGLVDTIRRDIVDGAAGLRLRTIVVRTRTWSGSEPGDGTTSDSDVTLDPVPKVEEPPARLVASSAGRWLDGDLQVSKISATYTADQLRGTPSAAQEFYWLIDGVPYRVVGEPAKEYLAWTVQLRPMQKRA